MLEELDNIECWHTGNGTKFSSGKYKAMHLGIANKNLCCKLGAQYLVMTEEAKSLGVLVDLKMTENCQYEAALMKSIYPQRYFQEKGKVLMPLYLLIKGRKLKM